MALGLITPGTSAANKHLGLSVPVTDGLSAIYMPRRTKALTARDLGPSGRTGTVTGEPDLQNTFAKFDPAAGSYMTSAVADANNMTVFVVAKTRETLDGSTNVNMLSTANGTSALDAGHNSAGVSLFYALDGSYARLSTARWNGSSSTNTAATLTSPDNPPATSWTLFCGRWSDTAVRLADMTRSKYATATPTVPYDPTTRNIVVGGRPNITSSHNGEVDLAFVAFYTRVVSDYERDLMGSFIRALMAADSITV